MTTPGTRQVKGCANMNQNQNGPSIVYQIKMQGRLDKSWSGWFSGMTITLDSDTTILTGAVADQSALRGILTKLWDLNLALISVAQIDMPEAKG